MNTNEIIIKRRILITGANGLLGQSIVNQLNTSKMDEVLMTSIESEFVGNSDFEYISLDITKKQEVKKLIYQFLPNVVINTAAFTNVDDCEIKKELCWELNVNAVKTLVDSCRTVDATLVHLSSDYVFDGVKGPYNEIDKVNPQSYYGKSKLASENEIVSGGIDSLIFRTNVIYGTQSGMKKDFVKWVVESINDKKKINIVDDQINNPTFSSDLAKGILLALDSKKSGIYNLAGIEILNRLEFAYLICDIFNLDKSYINPIKTQDLNQKAKRPLNSGLIILKAQSEFGYAPMKLKDNLNLIKKELYGE